MKGKFMYFLKKNFYDFARKNHPSTSRHILQNIFYLFYVVSITIEMNVKILYEFDTFGHPSYGFCS